MLANTMHNCSHLKASKVKVLLYLPFIFLAYLNNTQGQNPSYEVMLDLKDHRTASVICTLSCPEAFIHSDGSLYFHMWINAFNSKESQFAKQLIREGNYTFNFYSQNEMGGVSNLKVFQGTNELPYYFAENCEEWIAIDKTSLDGSNTIDLLFTYEIRLPKLISRSGYSDRLTSWVQWLPQIAIEQPNNKSLLPYLNHGEFYSPRADYSIKINETKGYTNVSKDYLVLKNETQAPLFFFNDSIDLTIVDTTFSNIACHVYYDYDREVWSHAPLLCQKIVNYYEDIIGPFPYKTLSIIQGNKDQRSGMEYPGQIVINKVKDVEELEYYLAHEIAHMYFYGAVSFNERNHAYMDEGLATYYEGRYTRHYHNTYHYNKLIPAFLIKGLAEHNIMHKSHEHLANLPLTRSTDTSPSQISALLYGINNYARASAIFTHLEKTLGTAQFDQAMAKTYLHLKGKSITPILFCETLQENSNIRTNWLLELFNNNSFDVQNKSNFVSVNDYNGIVPLPISYVKNQQICDTILWASQEQQLIGSNNYVIDPHCLFYTGPRKKKTTFQNFKFSLLPSLSHPSYQLITFTPVLRYSKQDQISTGLLFTNIFSSPSWEVILQPNYSWGPKSVTGEASLNKNISTSSLYKVMLSYKSFHHEYNEKNDYHLRYQKSKVGIETKSHNRKNTFNAEWSHITERRAIFDSTGYELKNFSFNNYRLLWRHIQGKVLHPYKLELTINGVPKYFDNQSFTKASLTFSQKFAYDSYHNFDLRVYGSYFLTNTRRTSLSANNFTVKGTESLFFSANNDYTYDYYFVDRQSRSSFNPTNVQGGFTNTIPNNSSFGQSNDMLFAINTKIDLPFIKSKSNPLKIYFDYGITSIYNNDSNRDWTSHYAGGIKLSILDDALSLSLPIFNSKNITQQYNVNNTNFLSRGLFSFNYNAVNPWNNFKEYLNKI